MAKVTKLSIQDNQKIKKPVNALVNWFNPENLMHNGLEVFKISSVAELKPESSIELHTIQFTTVISISYKATEERKIQVQDLRSNKLIDAVASKRIDDFMDKLICEYVVSIDRTNDVFAIVEERFESIANTTFRDKKKVVAVKSVTIDYPYPDISIKTYRDVFSSLLSLNEKAIYKNPTISLLLRLIEYGSSNYSPVFLEWYEEQFINPNNPYRALFGSAFKREYQQLKEKSITNTGTPSPIIVAREQPLSCVDAKQEITTEPVVDEPKEVTEPVETRLTPNSVINGQSVPASDPSDLLFEELASEVFFDDDDRDRIINRYNAWRHGQTEFKKDLLEAYGKCCAVTGCSSEEALEAAHIEPYSKTKNNDPTNGLLLRADIHTLFDRHLIGIDPDTMTVYVAPSLLKDYGQFDGKRLQLENKKLSPNKDALRTEYQDYKKNTFTK
ncbi:MAG: HNH endonuclease [Pseudanabaenaceae cyanobacterium]